MKVFKHLADLNKIVLSSSVAKVMRLFIKEDIYLISERENEAEDNGYYLFKYIRENYPQEKAYYLINKSSKSYRRVEKMGNVIQYNSLKHYIYYFLSKKHVSAFQFFGVPDSALIWFLESKGYFKKKRVFLQHGVTQSNLNFLEYNNTNYRIFICAAEPEYDYIKNQFGYPEKNVMYTGFSRYDGLHEKNTIKKQILLMPTWRQWLGMTNSANNKIQDEEVLLNSNYYKTYSSLLNSNNLDKLLKEKEYELLFYLHPEAQRFKEYFSTKSSKIKIISREEVVLQDLLKESEILITDYSSIGFEFGYMRKKMMYYQFDSKEYYENHFKKGYFDAELNGFGKVIKEEAELLENLFRLINDKEIESIYKERAKLFFPIYDKHNSKRIFEVIKNI
ncbi:MAG: CDP-glycerol glycerophosphotransferase family protein [Cetobacterium sp.]